MKKTQNKELVYFYKIINILDNNIEINFLVTEFIGIYDKFYCSYQLIEKPENIVCLNFKKITFKKPYESHSSNKTDLNYNYIIGSSLVPQT